MRGGTAKHIENISGEVDCEMYVRQQYPEAPGATWHLSSGCWAEFGEHMEYSSSHRTCIFHPGHLTRSSH